MMDEASRCSASGGTPSARRSSHQPAPERSARRIANGGASRGKSQTRVRYLGSRHIGLWHLSAGCDPLALPDEQAVALRNAGFLHDLGRVSVSNGIWGKPGPLSAAEWERVRLHAYYSERILSQSPSLVALAPTVGMHHERLDGSGYHRAAPATMLNTPARVLAAADVYQSLTEERPHRPALTAQAAAEQLRNEAQNGRLDRPAVTAVLDAAGHEKRPTRSSWPADLTDREVEVLRLLAQGRTRKQIATSLFISESTVHTHTTHIYEKTGLSNRASIALYSIENDLIHS
jgi:DNA-binding CsgD family transcriptional regulator